MILIKLSSAWHRPTSLRNFNMALTSFKIKQNEFRTLFSKFNFLRIFFILPSVSSQIFFDHGNI